ncbi:hypothetical protein M0811_14526 [Anaeramoeba ignava]|uniref:Tetratricopeptide repeat protein n=1 Tax=Anaeramoeba ignava TaxID=1746090 RepID=A0A9Q0LXE6_ANAIG|nr:hypothetical protein M0811_14526 [Anaeramoeba ignava]
MALEIIEKIFEIGCWIKNKFDEYKETKVEAKRLIERIEALEKPLEKIKQFNDEKSHIATLRNVLKTVEKIKSVVENYEKKNAFSKFFSSTKKEFEKFDNQLSSYVGDLNLELMGMAQEKLDKLNVEFEKMRNDQIHNQDNIQELLKKISVEVKEISLNKEKIPQNENSNPLEHAKNLEFVETLFGLEPRSAKIFCDILKIDQNISGGIVEILRKSFEFLKSNQEEQLSSLFQAWDLNHDKRLDQYELEQVFGNLKLLLICLEIKKSHGSIHNLISKMNEEEKQKFYDQIKNLEEKLDLKSDIEQLFEFSKKEKKDIDFQEFRNYCKKEGNFVLQFLGAILSLFNQEFGETLTNSIGIVKRSYEKEKKKRHMEKLFQIPDHLKNRLTDQGILHDPVSIKENSYERKDIERILKFNPKNPQIYGIGIRFTRKDVVDNLGLKDAINEWKKTKIEACLKFYHEIKESDPDSAYLILKFALSLKPQKMESMNKELFFSVIDEAIYLLQNQLKDKEELAKKQYLKGKILCELKDYEKGEDILCKSLGNTEEDQMKEKILSFLKKVYKSRNFVAKILETDTTLAEIYSRSDPKKAKDILVNLQNQNHKSIQTPEVYALLILVDEALHNPKNSAIWCLKQGIAYAKKNDDRAIQSFQRAFEVDPDLINAFEDVVHQNEGENVQTSNQEKEKEKDQKNMNKEDQLIIQKMSKISQMKDRNHNLINKIVRNGALSQSIMDLEKSEDIQELKKIYQQKIIEQKQAMSYSEYIVKREQELRKTEKEINQKNKAIQKLLTLLELKSTEKKAREWNEVFDQSLIIMNKTKYTKKLKKWINDDEFFMKMKKGYSAIKDGFSSQNWHKAVDGKGKTLVIIKTTEDFIFGGFTSVGWQKSSCLKFTEDSKAFLFSLKNDINDRKPQLFPIRKEHQKNAIYYSDENFGPCFGSGFDLCLKSDLQPESTNFGVSYNHPKGMTNQTIQSKRYLAGSNNSWKVEELETYFI